jgi:hypothetical protein
MNRRITKNTRAAGGAPSRRFRRNAVCLATVFLLPAVHPSLYAGEDKPAAPVLTLDQVVEGLARMNRCRVEALKKYTSVREYHLKLDGIVHRRADMIARMTYVWPDQKTFQIVSESGSELMRNRVLKAAMEAEKESLRKDNRERTTLTPDNYEFALDAVEGSPPVFYVLKATPRISNKFLFRGKIWVNPQDFAVSRVECEPAKNPSWWTKKNQITTTYQKVGDFWLPAHMQSVTDVRIFGRSVLTIDYKDYNLIEARKFRTTAQEGETVKPPAGADTGPSPEAPCLNRVSEGPV